MNKIISLFFITCFLLACKSKETKILPILGNPTMVNGVAQAHRIPDFAFLNQDSIIITNTDLENHIYLADFFFTSCPSICPKVMKQMMRIYDKYENNDKVKLVSYTIDPKRDTPKILKLYAHNLDVNVDKWIFLTGEKEKLLDIADKYFVTAYEDDSVPGGFDHSGKILLIDRKRHIRSFAEGTDSESVDKLLLDIDILLSSMEDELK